MSVPSRVPSRPLDGDCAGWRMIDVPERGTTFAYDRRHPSRSAPTVVLLHGWTATGSLNWSATIAALEVRYRVVGLDHRGHGRGIHGDGTFSLEDCAVDVAALLAVLGVRRAIFVGYSMGGPVAQLIWRRHRHLVDGLVLCATAADFTSPHVDEQLLRAVDEMWRATGPISPLDAYQQASRQPPVGGGADRQPAPRCAGTSRRRRDPRRRAGHRPVLLDRVDHERRRAGRGHRHVADRLVRPAQQWQLAALISRARTITVDAGHFAPFRRPELIAGAVTASCDNITEPIDSQPAAAGGPRCVAHDCAASCRCEADPGVNPPRPWRHAAAH